MPVTKPELARPGRKVDGVEVLAPDHLVGEAPRVCEGDDPVDVARVGQLGRAPLGGDAGGGQLVRDSVEVLLVVDGPAEEGHRVLLGGVDLQAPGGVVDPQPHRAVGAVRGQLGAEEAGAEAAPVLCSGRVDSHVGQ